MTTTLPLFYSREYHAPANKFDTFAKAGWVAYATGQVLRGFVELVAPTPLTGLDLAVVHDPRYVRAVKLGSSLWVPGARPGLAQSNGFQWEPGIWTSACASNAGVVAAARTALFTGTNAGSLSSGLHHARRGEGAGFCTFNGLALAARAVIADGATNVLILDLDAHCGGGTAAMTASWPEVRHIDISVSEFDAYDPTWRQTLHLVTKARRYLATIESALDAAERPDVLIYNAGMDPHEHSAIGGLTGITTAMLLERERLVFTWARLHGVPVAFVLAGGYVSDKLDIGALADLHLATVVNAQVYGPAVWPRIGMVA